VGVAGGEHGRDLVVVGGVDDGVGRAEVGAAAQPQQVGVGAARGVGDAGEVVVADVLGAAGGGRELRAGLCGERGRRQLDPVEGDGRGAGSVHAELVAQQRGGGAGERGVVAVDAPAPPAHARCERVGHGDSTP
jgi:hypothetical protein